MIIRGLRLIGRRNFSLDQRLSPGPKSRATAAMEKSKAPRVSQADLVKACMFKSPAPLIDIGANLTDRSFENDRMEVVSRADNMNVKSMIVTGTCLKSCASAQDLCSSTTTYPLFFTAGIHPHHAKSCDESTLGALRQLATDPKCVAIGECGLDFNRNFSPQDVQLKWFEEQVILAKEMKKPLFMHCRDAWDHFCDILKRHSPLGTPAVIHCFTGSSEDLRRCLDLDLHIGITGWVCDERPERGGAELASLLPMIPQHRLMIETDAPYLAPRSITPSKARPSRNEPALLPHVLRAVAQATGMSEAEVAQQTTQVAISFFGLRIEASC